MLNKIFSRFKIFFPPGPWENQYRNGVDLAGSQGGSGKDLGIVGAILAVLGEQEHQFFDGTIRTFPCATETLPLTAHAVLHVGAGFHALPFQANPGVAALTLGFQVLVTTWVLTYGTVPDRGTSAEPTLLAAVEIAFAFERLQGHQFFDGTSRTFPDRAIPAGHGAFFQFGIRISAFFFHANPGVATRALFLQMFLTRRVITLGTSPDRRAFAGSIILITLTPRGMTFPKGRIHDVEPPPDPKLYGTGFSRRARRRTRRRARRRTRQMIIKESGVAFLPGVGT